MKKAFFKLLNCLVIGVGSACAFANTSVIRFATEPTYPPFEFLEKGTLKGFDVELVQGLCEILKTSCEMQQLSWDTLIPSLQRGKIDGVFGAIAMTPERSKQVLFTKPYLQATIQFLAAKDKHLELTVAGLTGKTIGMQGGTTFDQYVIKTFGLGVKIRRYPSQQMALLDLKAKRIDAVLGDTAILKYWVKQGLASDFQLVGAPISPEGKAFDIGIAVQLNNASLQLQLNQALEQFEKTGQLAALKKKYFGEP